MNSSMLFFRRLYHNIEQALVDQCNSSRVGGKRVLCVLDISHHGVHGIEVGLAKTDQDNNVRAS